jgi:hypothetical protein
MHGLLEDLLAFELPLGLAEDAAWCAYPAPMPCTRRISRAFAVTAEPLGQQAFLAVGGLEHHGGGAVAEQHRDVAVVQSMNGEMISAPMTSAFLTTPVRISRGGRRQRIQEAGAGGVDVHGRAAVGADAPLDARGDVRHLVVVAGGAEHDEFDVLALHPAQARARARPRSRSRQGTCETRRSRMPVRVRIHSSLVSRKVARSALLRTAGGRHLPHR